MSRLSIVSILMVFTFIFAACGGGGDDAVLAEVGSTVITVGDFTEAYINMKPEDRPAIAAIEDREKFLDDLINKEVMELCAFEAYPELVERQTWRLKRFRDKTLTDLAKALLIKDYLKITTEMKDRTYENMKRELNLLAMLVTDPDAAEYVKKQLDSGADFGTLSRDHSSQWATGKTHGDLGWTKVGKFPYGIDIAVWEAEIGSTVGPLKTSRGSYIVRILDERPAEPEGTREDLDALIHQNILEPIYLNRQKEVQDSLRAASDPYISSEAKALITMKYYWEIPEDQADNPMAVLDANRIVPTFTAEEAATIVVDFKGEGDWSAAEFAERLSWYPAGLWPRGQDDKQLADCIKMMLRDYLYIKAAKDLGFADEDFERKVENMSHEMRVTYFYYNNLMPGFEPEQAEIDSFFQANRESYRAPQSYKVGFFGARDKELIDDLYLDWKAGMAFLDLREKYEALNPELVAMGESEWLYVGEDVIRDEIIDPLKEGGICEPITRSDVTMIFKLVARRSERLFSYGEIKETVVSDAKTVISDVKLATYLAERRGDFTVKINHKALEKMQRVTPEDEEA